jgi:CRISPR-associated protein Csx3
VSERRQPATPVVFYSIGAGDTPALPSDPLPPLPDIPRGALVIVEGRTAVWRYGRAFHLLHGSAAGAIATYDPKLGAVVVASHRPEYREGDVFEISPPEKPTGPA